MLDYGMRGKEHTSTVKRWTVLVHAMQYEEPELVEKTENILKTLRAKDDKRLEENTQFYLGLGYRVLEAIYHGAHLTSVENI